MKICYFGIYKPDFGRNRVYMAGLKQNGVEVIECRDTSAGLLKYWRLWQKHRLIKDSYDAMIVGYPGHIIVPFAKLISKKPVIFDALCTLYEGEVISRGKYRWNVFMKAWVLFIDLLAVKSADLILVETDAQRDFFIKRFHLNPAKVARVFTGADDTVFHPDASVAKRPRFTAVFRGKLLPEAGVKYVIQAAKALEDQDIDFLIIGDGYLEAEVGRMIKDLKPTNVEWITHLLSDDELRRKVLACHVSLGQFEDHDRLKRTIPHKAFEALALGMPYVTGRVAGISELLTDGKDCLMTELADPADLAQKVMMLKNDPELAKKIAQNGQALFREKLTPKALIASMTYLTSSSLR